MMRRRPCNYTYTRKESSHITIQYVEALIQVDGACQASSRRCLNQTGAGFGSPAAKLRRARRKGRTATAAVSIQHPSNLISIPFIPFITHASGLRVGRPPGQAFSGAVPRCRWQSLEQISYLTLAAAVPAECTDQLALGFCTQHLQLGAPEHPIHTSQPARNFLTHHHHCDSIACSPFHARPQPVSRPGARPRWHDPWCLDNLSPNTPGRTQSLCPAIPLHLHAAPLPPPSHLRSRQLHR